MLTARKGGNKRFIQAQRKFALRCQKSHGLQLRCLLHPFQKGKKFPSKENIMSPTLWFGTIS